MRLTCLGSGGGRQVVDTQVLPTGGYRVSTRSGLELHVDPGPGAHLHALSKRLSADPFTLNALFISHGHLDHENDAGVLIECMTYDKPYGSFGTLLAPTSVLHGLSATPSKHGTDPRELLFDRGVERFFQRMVNRVEELTPGAPVDLFNPEVAQTVDAQGKRHGDHIATLTPTRTDHEDTSAVGFVLDADGVKLGYTADTNAYDGLAAQYDGVTAWLVNCLSPFGEHIDYHLSCDDVATALNGMSKKPKRVILSHFGQGMIDAGIPAQCAKLEKKTGVPVIPSQLGLLVPIE